MTPPWESEDTGDHDVSERTDGIYECSRCGKLATKKNRFKRTDCEPPDKHL